MITSDYHHNFTEHSGRVLYRYRHSPVLRKRWRSVLWRPARMAKEKADRTEVIRYILSKTSEAELQYSFLLFYYKCLEVISPRHHNYRPLNDEEVTIIIRLKKSGYSIYAISKQLNRHPSTIFYFLKRMPEIEAIKSGRLRALKGKEIDKFIERVMKKLSD